MSAQPKTYMTIEEYLAFEETSTEKHEYYAGQIYALAGGSEQHNIIASNVNASLHGQLRKRPCTIYPSDMRIKIQHTGLYTYPDISIVCGPSVFDAASRTTLLNPIVIIEILSPSTEKYDRGKKFQNYRMIESLQEYILITQYAYQVEQYIRQTDGQWLFNAVDQADEGITLPSIACTLAIADIYEKVQFNGD